jgi:hypothetical protein
MSHVPQSDEEFTRYMDYLEGHHAEIGKKRYIIERRKDAMAVTVVSSATVEDHLRALGRKNWKALAVLKPWEFMALLQVVEKGLIEEV